MSDIRFLVTGATGATGSAAATQLLDKGRRVRAFVHREDWPRAKRMPRSRELAGPGSPVRSSSRRTPFKEVATGLGQHDAATDTVEQLDPVTRLQRRDSGAGC